MYETIRWATKRLMSQGLKGLGIAVLIASCALAVYLGAVLLARMAVWACFP